MKLATVWIVIPTAAYDHGCIGVFTTLDKARECAEMFWHDSDGHHDLRIEERTLDAIHMDGGPGRYDYEKGDPWFDNFCKPTTDPPKIEVVPLEA